MRAISRITQKLNFPRKILLHGGMWVGFLANSSIYFVLPIYSFKFVIIWKESSQSFSGRAQNYPFCHFQSGITSPSMWPATKTTTVATQLSRRSRITAYLALTVYKPGINKHLAKKLCFSCVRKHCSSLLAPQDLVLPYSLCLLFYQRLPKIWRETGDVTSEYFLANNLL
jgi:hypothetical protein